MTNWSIDIHRKWKRGREESEEAASNTNRDVARTVRQRSAHILHCGSLEEERRERDSGAASGADST